MTTRTHEDVDEPRTSVVGAIQVQRRNIPRTTLDALTRAIQDLRMEDVQHHFNTTRNPFRLIGNVSVQVFNEYFGSDEALIKCRFVEIIAGQVAITELPSRRHEDVVQMFNILFLTGFGALEVSVYGTSTFHRPNNPAKEADLSYGPLREHGPQRIRPPRGVRIDNWVTLVVEVAITQTWDSLQRAALWWYCYPGMQYIILLDVAGNVRTMTYYLYDVQMNPLCQPNVVHQDISQLTNAQVALAIPLQPSATQVLQYDRHGAPVIVQFCNRRILQIPNNQPLPHGVNDFTEIDLRQLMQLAMRQM